MNRKTNTITPTIVEGVIAVANHKLRVEGLESYKQFLAKTFYFKEDMWDALKEGEDYERKRIFENLSHAVCYGINGDVTEEELDRVEKYLKQFSNSQQSVQNHTHRLTKDVACGDSSRLSKQGSEKSLHPEADALNSEDHAQ